MGRKKISKYTFNDLTSLEDKLKKVLTLFELDRSAQILAEINKITQREKLPFYEALDRLFEEELHRREDSRIQRWTKQAKFPWTASFKDYDFTYPKYIDKNAVLNLSNCEWIKTGGNIIFLGPSGVGKTHLSIALGLEAIVQGYETRFITARQLVEIIDIAIQKDGGNGSGDHRKKLLSIFSNISLLILDDLAYSNMQPQSGDFLFQLLCERYDRNKSTVLTGNEGIDAWEKGLFSGNRAQTMAIADRFLEDCVAINIKGDSYRGNYALSKKTERVK